VASKTVGDQPTHRIGGGWVALGELGFDNDMNGRMQLRISGVVRCALVVTPYGSEAVCFRGSQPLNRVRRDLWVISH
jgi:hypothetical protein